MSADAPRVYYGWYVLGGLAAALALITIPIHAFVLRGRPADVGLLPDGDGRVDVTRPDVARAAHAGIASIPKLAWLLALIFGASTLRYLRALEGD